MLLLLGAMAALSVAYQVPQRIALDLASDPAAKFLTGVHDAERGYRWTEADAALWLSGLGGGNQAWRGALRLSGSRPNGAEAPQVSLRLNGNPFATFSPAAQEHEFPLAIAPGALGANGDFLLEIAAETFTPQDDQRELGVRVFEIWLEPEGGIALPSLKALALALLAGLALWATTKVVTATAPPVALVMAAAVGISALGVFVSRVETLWWLSLAALATTGLAASSALVAWIAPRGGLSAPQWRRALALFALAALVRLALDTGRGYEGDVAIYLSLAWKTVAYGIHAAYELIGEVPPPNTPPFLLYPFWLAGALYRELFAPAFPPTWVADPPLLRFLLRMPSLLADLLAGALILRLTVTVPEARRSERWWLPLAAYLFNPALIFDGAYWGQTAAIHTLWMLAAVVAAGRGRHGWAGAALALAVLTKPQALAIAPLLGLLAWRERGAIRFALAGVMTSLALAAPFIAGGTFGGVVEQAANTAEYHPYLSANAHNLWWLFSGGQGWQPDTLGFGMASARAIGIVLFALASTLSLAAVWRRRDGLELAAAYQSLAFFMLLTQIHENHALPLFAPLALACAGGRASWRLYGALALTALANMLLHDPALLQALGYAAEEIYGGEGLALPRLLNAAAQCGLFVWMTAVLLRGSLRQPGN